MPLQKVARNGPDPIDVHVGGRLRGRRTLMGMSQMKLGEAVELTFQQVQKYEKGTNRMGSSRLYQFSRILDVPVSYFFEELSPDESAPMGDELEKNPLHKRETLEFVRAYYRIADETARKRVFELTKAIAKMDDD